MQDERNASQIIRKDARNCFVESLSDAFANGRAHFAFATYDMNKPAGQRQTNNSDGAPCAWKRACTVRSRGKDREISKFYLWLLEDDDAQLPF